ncbi:hypothetical protein TRFO_20642 [Tritrichomonas foetus]|uniref:ubiquitinyl hydrolase 1 n=1 Tax=Tritrichomonas foetus TaxID=1144522 RepID=A0A1J4KJZ7_9EUKA|nr:hypothetical protein TRFO_20642 [Tritrichomonas foetus]|eukprot:OHT10172.1 hypothetical protein TRFO_20642 [Tritrichomonas foetus]
MINPDQSDIEKIVRSNGAFCNIIFNAEQISKTQYKSPIYLFHDKKIQIILDFKENNIMVSLICNGEENKMDGMEFDFYLSNQNPLKTIKFNHKNQLPYQVNLKFDDINQDQGWFSNNVFRTVLVIKEVRNHTRDIPFIFSKNNSSKIEWKIDSLSEFHSSQQFQLGFADVVLMLTIEDSFYNFSMAFENFDENGILVKYVLIIHNSDEMKNIRINAAEWISLMMTESKPIVLKQIGINQYTSENGWIIDGALQISIEFNNTNQKFTNLLQCSDNHEITKSKINNNSKEKETNEIQFFKLSDIDYIQLSFENHESFTQFIVNDYNTDIFTQKYKLDDIFCTVSFNIENGFTFSYENFQHNFIACAKLEILNKDQNKSHSFEFSKRLTLDGKREFSITKGVPFDKRNIESEGFLIDGKIVSKIKFTKYCSDDEIILKNDKILRFPKINNNEYNVRFEIPKNCLKSQLINLPTLLLNNKKVKLLLHKDAQGNFFLLSHFVKSFDHIAIVNLIFENQNNEKNKSMNWDIFKSEQTDTLLKDITYENLTLKESGFLNSNNCISMLLNIIYTTDFQNYISSEPPVINYKSFDNSFNTEKNSTHKKVEDSSLYKVPTTYAGLVNQGATCYMNSMLQALFHLPAFRRVVYGMPTTGAEDPEKSIPLNLQRLFCELQTSKDPVSTEPLTKSFGWGSEDTVMQHDVEEFARVLIDNLDIKMKGTEQENSISDLFKGKMRHAIRCKNVDFTSYREEDFLDLSIDVEGCKNLTESFNKYIAKEELTGDNQYSAEGFGKQDAIMCEEFISFPAVLHLHLRRFQFDYNTSRMRKINDYFEFPEQIDLTQFLAHDAPDREKNNLYDLYGVLVHSGGVYGGHYNAFLRTSTENQWFNFNDSTVTRVSRDRAIHDNYGTDSTTSTAAVNSSSFDFLGTKYDSIHHNLPETSGHKKTNHSGLSSSGYMLIYVRHDDAPMLYNPIPNDSIPSHLLEYIKHNNEHKKYYSHESAYKKNDECRVYYFTENDVKKNCAAGLKGFVPDEKVMPFISILRSDPQSKIYEDISKKTGFQIGRFRIQNCIFGLFPSKPLECNAQKIDSLISYDNKIKVFIQEKTEDEPITFQARFYTMFLKFFYPGKPSPLQYLGSLRSEYEVPNSNTNIIISKCVDYINKKLGFPKDTKLIPYTETTTGIFEFSKQNFLNTENCLIFTFPEEIPNYPETCYDFTNKDYETENNQKIDYPPNQQDKSEDTNNYDNENKNDEHNTVKVYNASDFYRSFNTNTIQGYLNASSMIELEIYTITKQFLPQFRVNAPTRITFDQIRELIAKINELDYNPKSDSMLLFNIKKSDGFYNERIRAEMIDTKFCYKSLDAIIRFQQNSKNIKLYYFFMKNVEYDKASKINFISCSFSPLSSESNANESNSDSNTLNNIDVSIIYPCIQISLEDFIEKFHQISEIDIGKGPFRLLAIYSHQIYECYSKLDEIIKFQPTQKYILEEVPQDQINIETSTDSFLIKVSFKEENDYLPKDYGDPFLFKVIKDELFSETLIRLRKYMKVSETDPLDNYRFKLSLQANTNLTFNKKYTEMLDNMVLFDKCCQADEMIIFSPSKDDKKSSNMFKASPHSKSNDVKIYN